MNKSLLNFFKYGIIGGTIAWVTFGAVDEGWHFVIYSAKRFFFSFITGIFTGLSTMIFIDLYIWVKKKIIKK